MKAKLPRGWKRPECHARWYSECIELVVAYGGYDTRWEAWANMGGEAWEIGIYTSEQKAMEEAERFAEKALKKALRRLEHKP